MTKFSPACSYTISLAVALLAGACTTLSSPEEHEVPQETKQETSKANPPQDRLHEVAVGDTLSGIALQITGDARNWKTIADLNNITDPNTIRKGQVIVIPHSLIPTQASLPVAHSRPESSSEKSPDEPVPASETLAQDGESSQTRDRSGRAPLPDPEKPRQQEETGGWLIIRGTNFPREINTGPDSSSDILMQAWPGTRMQYIDRTDGWFKVITDKGQGYLNPDYATVRP